MSTEPTSSQQHAVNLLRRLLGPGFDLTTTGIPRHVSSTPMDIDTAPCLCHERAGYFKVIVAENRMLVIVLDHYSLNLWTTEDGVFEVVRVYRALAAATPKMDSIAKQATELERELRVRLQKATKKPTLDFNLVFHHGTCSADSSNS